MDSHRVTLAGFLQFGRTMRPALLFAAALTTACGLDDDGDAQEMPPPPPPPPAAPLATAGTYRVVSTLDVQAAAVLPQNVYDSVDALRGLRDAPGETLFDLADEGGVPLVKELRAALPEALESKLYGWIDEHLEGVTYGDGPVAAAIDDIVTTSETVLGTVELVSDLDLAAPSSQHRLRQVAFNTTGAQARFDLAATAGLPLTLEASVVTRIDASPSGAQLMLDEHAFGFHYGTLAYLAFENALRARTGRDLRENLAVLVDCQALAAAVSRKCVLSACVGHEAELRGICEGGLDYLASSLRARLEAVRFDAVALRRGDARLIAGATSDGRADDVVDGVWSAEINVGQGPRKAPATFAGHRSL